MKNLIVIVVLALSMALLNSCEKEQFVPETETQFKVDFEKFSLGVENNTLVFDTEEDLQGCIDYLNEIGDKNLDDFEEAIGYKSYRSTGKELEGYDEVMKTLINPNMENVICGYLTVSNFEEETAVAYKLEGHQLCNLANVDRSELGSFNFTFNDDFFEFVEHGAIMKASSDYCIGWTDTDNDVVTMSIYNNSVTVLTKADYSRSFFYKYLEIFYQVHTTCTAPGLTISASYATRNDDQGNSICYYNKNDKESDDNPFERSEEFGPQEVDDEYGLTVTFSRKPYTGTSRLERYNLDVDYYLQIVIPSIATINKSYHTRNFCLYDNISVPLKF